MTRSPRQGVTQVRQAVADYDFHDLATTLHNFCAVDLSAFYFDIRKDSLYCDAPSSRRRKSAMHVVRVLFDCTVKWLAPLLPFTTEEAWQERHPESVSVHLEQFPPVPEAWLDEELAAKWRLVRRVRRVVTGALEIERREKRIGSSLEAAPLVHIADPALRAVIASVDMAEICITSGFELGEGEPGADAFRLDDVDGVAVEVRPAQGRKCARSWRYTLDVGSDPDFPDVSARDAAALRELAAAGRL